MSSSTHCAEFAGQKPAARFPEKPSFSQTCSLLSQYFKEKGGFRDLSLGMTCNTEANGTVAASRQPTTMNLFPCEVSRKDPVAQDLKPKDFFPSQFGFSCSAPKEDTLKMIDSGVNRSVNPEPQTAQMTIFYAGQVMVFNDFPAGKAKEIMNFASNGSDKSNMAFTSTGKNNQSAFSPNLTKNPTESRSSVPPTSNHVPNFGKNLAQEQHVQPSSAPISCELPIARRASLHRFLEKRKDRITSKAPYQTNSTATASSKPAETKTWLALSAQAPQ